MWKEPRAAVMELDRKSTRLNSSHDQISYAVFCLKKKEHTSELQSRSDLVCRLLLEKKNCPAPAAGTAYCCAASPAPRVQRKRRAYTSALTEPRSTSCARRARWCTPVHMDPCPSTARLSVMPVSSTHTRPLLLTTSGRSLGGLSHSTRLTAST